MWPVFVFISLISLTSPLLAVDFIKYFTFSERGVLKLWKEKILKGKVDYRIKEGPEGRFVQALSKQAASGLYYEIKYNPRKTPYLSWKWKVDEFPKKVTDNKTQIDDFAARIYVIFPANIFIFSRCIEYVWDDVLPEGAVTSSPLSSRIRVFVIRHGQKKGWVQEERNVFKDYLQAFGEEEEEFDDEVGAIAFMTDSDDTRSLARSYFDEVKIGYAKPIMKKR